MRKLRLEKKNQLVNKKQRENHVCLSECESGPLESTPNKVQGHKDPTGLISAVLRIVYATLLYNSKLIKMGKDEILFYKIVNLIVFNLIFVGFQNFSCQNCTDRIFSSYINHFF